MSEAPAVEIVGARNSPLRNEDAQRVFRVASRLKEEERTAENFLELARPPDSEVHHLFPWNDREAAEEHRKEVARRLLRNVRVRVIHQDGSHTERHAFFSVQTLAYSDKATRYVRYTKLTEEEDLRQTVVRKARRDLESFRNRYLEYREILEEAEPALVEIMALADALLSRDDDEHAA